VEIANQKRMASRLERNRSLRICTWLLVLFGVGIANRVSAAEPAFALRGYYLTFMRMPAMGLTEWKRAVDCFAADDVNTLVLWMPGGFRSRKFPLTWRYNADHPNVRQDFVRELIDYAHTRQIRVLLGFTPFGYDGVNQMPLEHPEWKAKKADGSPVDEFGIHSWGWSLCPAHSEARQFMQDYLHEMIFDFYPNADGMMVESSDYNVCQCADCRARPYEEEFRLAKSISAEVWKARPRALILVYPHYFTGKKVPGLESAAARQPFDARWGLVFTPHSAHFDAELIAQAKVSVYSGPEAALGSPAGIAEGARAAQTHGVKGYLPSFEAFSYVATRPEGGEPYFVGRRRRPLGLDAEREGRMPYDQLLPRVQRFAMREFSREPGLSMAAFERRLGETIFSNGKAEGNAAEVRSETPLPLLIADLLDLQRIWNFEADWYWPSPLLDPAFFRQRAQRTNWSAEKRQTYQRHFERLREIAARYADSANPAAKEMGRLAGEIVKAWGNDTPFPTLHR
jgi:hypothetical protein